MVQAASKKQCDDDQTFHTHNTPIHHFWLTISHMQHLSSHHILSLLVWWPRFLCFLVIHTAMIFSTTVTRPLRWFFKTPGLVFLLGGSDEKNGKKPRVFFPERYLWVWECRRGLKEEAGLELTGLVTKTYIFCSVMFWLFPISVLNASI